jgi:hypothetical protein
MFFIIDLHHTPRILSSPDLPAIWSTHEPVRANDSERDLARNLLRFSDTLLVFVVIGRGSEDLDLVVSNVRENLREMSQK